MKHEIGYDREGRKDGPERWFYADGRKRYQGLNRQGRRHGPYTAWHENGQKWFEGRDEMGRPEGEARFYHPDGKLKSVILYRQGLQLDRQDFDLAGRPLHPRIPPPASAPPAEVSALPDSVEKARSEALAQWAQRVRSTVESYWKPPKGTGGSRAVALLRVDRFGSILGVDWVEKSPQKAFNQSAAATFKKLRRLPPPPPGLPEAVLSLRYEFGKAPARGAWKRLKERKKAEAVAPEDAAPESP